MIKADHREPGGYEGWWLVALLLFCAILLWLAIWGL